MFSTIRRIGLSAAGGVMVVGLLSGCITVDQKPVLPSVDVSIPTMPTIPGVPIDPSKPLGVHAEEWKRDFFANIYCPLRNTPIADAIADEGKRLWNELAQEAQRQGAPIPPFDPSDPKMCQ